MRTKDLQSQPYSTHNFHNENVFYSFQEPARTDNEASKLVEANAQEKYLNAIEQETEDAKAEAKKFQEESNNVKMELQKAQAVIEQLEREKKEIGDKMKEAEKRAKALVKVSEKQKSIDEKAKKVINF